MERRRGRDTTLTDYSVSSINHYKIPTLPKGGRKELHHNRSSKITRKFTRIFKGISIICSGGDKLDLFGWQSIHKSKSSLSNLL